MKHTHHNGSDLPLDWITSQALGGHQVESEAYQQRAKHENHLRSKQNSLKSKCVEAQALEVKLDTEISKHANSNVEYGDLLSEAKTTLAKAIEDIIRARRYKEAFRVRHGLTRDPSKPKTTQNLLFLTNMVFVEAGINTSFFQNAHMVADPFAALSTSLLISVTNVLACASAGYFIGRWKDYGLNAVDANTPPFAKRRKQARSLFWFFLGTIGFFHATVGLVRALESLDKVNHEIASYLTMLTTPEAVFLVLTGSCLSVLAYQKGKHAFADPYPGYGEHQEIVTNLEDELLDTKDDLSQQIEERFDDAKHILEKSYKQEQRNFIKYNNHVEKCFEDQRKLEQAVGASESQICTQLSTIADHHRAVSGVNAKGTATFPENLVSFKNYLDIEMPAFHHPPKMKTQIAKLNDDKSEALSQLNTIFQNILENNSGEQL